MGTIRCKPDATLKAGTVATCSAISCWPPNGSLWVSKRALNTRAFPFKIHSLQLDSDEAIDTGKNDFSLSEAGTPVDLNGDSFPDANITLEGFLTEDLNGAERIMDGDGDGESTVDLGAYEKQPSL